MGIDPVSLAITVALNAAVMGMNAMRKIEGPRLADLSVTVADYGTPLNNFRGTRRLEVPCFYAEPITETKHRRKGKSGKYREYEYSGTFAVVVADHEVSIYERIWLDRRLAYDSTSGTVDVSLNLMDYCRLYYGTSDQEPDERMLATIEAEEGAGTCPAYLDVAYIMFEGLPLQPFGNRFPQVSTQVSTEGVSVVASIGDEIVFVGGQLLPKAFGTGAHDYAIALTGGIAATPAEGDTVLVFATNSGAYSGVPEVVVVGYERHADSWTSDSSGLLDLSLSLFSKRMDSSPDTTVRIMVDAPIALTSACAGIMLVFRNVHVDVLDVPAVVRNDYSGVAHPDPITLANGITIDPGELNVQSDSENCSITAALKSTSGEEALVIAGSGQINTPVGGWGPGNLAFSLDVDADDAPGCWLGVAWGLTLAFGSGTTLGEICEVAALGGGMSAEDFDFSALDQPIPGYSWTQGSGKDIVGPLLELHDSEVRQNGFTLEGIKRGGAVLDDAISYEDFVRTGTEPAYEITLTSESDLPRRIYVTYADFDAEQQPNTAMYQRSAESVRTLREISIDLTTYAVSADDIQPLVERVLRRRWIGDMGLRFSLPPFFLSLLPGSIRTVLLEDDQIVRARVTHMSVSPNRVITLTWERDRAGVTTASEETDAIDLIRESPGAPAAGRPEPSLFQPVGSELFVLDVPLLSDADDRAVPFLIVAAAPLSDGDWPGADTARSDSGMADSYEFGFAGFGSADGTPWGIVSAALPDALPHVIDEASQIVVQLTSDYVLESVTEEALLADQTLNQFLIGDYDRWEIGQFRDAVLQSDGEWILSGLIRGARGTERFTSTHEAGDAFILATSAMVRKEIGASEIGDRDWYKVATVGAIDDYDDPVSILFAAEAHRPYSVAHLDLERDPLTGDITLRWLRRSRIGGATISGQDIPLGESSEQYRIRFYNGATAVRTENLDWTGQADPPEFFYSSYEQINDFGSLQEPLDYEVVQLSPTLGIEGVATRESA